MEQTGVLRSVSAIADRGSTLAAAAHELGRASVPVFPCSPGGKQPMTAHGFHDATTDLRQIDAWWGQAPAANIGVPTGGLSGVVVVDVDVGSTADGYQAFNRAHELGLVSGWEFLVQSPSGGLHAYFPATQDSEQRSWQAARAGIDFRGDGGYIIVPPSRRMIDGHQRAYRLELIGSGPTRTLNAGRLRDFLDPRPPPQQRASQQTQRDLDTSRLASWVAQRQEGERNAGLFWAACRLVENGLDPPEALDVLSPAADHAGLEGREIERTIRSAYRTVNAPRTAGTHHEVQHVGFGAGPSRSSSPTVRGLS